MLGAGYITWFAALKRLPASFVTIGSLLVPVVGVLASAAAGVAPRVMGIGPAPASRNASRTVS